MGALAHGNDRLACLCSTPDCPAATNPPTTGVIIHIIAHHDTLPSDENGRCGPSPEDLPTPDHERDEPETDSNATDPAPEPADDRAAGGAAECADLDGIAPSMFTKPLREMTVTELYAACDRRPRQLSTIRPAAMMNGRLLPGAIARSLLETGGFRPQLHPQF